MVNPYKNEYKWGDIDFRQFVSVGQFKLDYTTIPYGYLVRDQENISDLYVFETYQDIINYFTEGQ